MTILAWHFIGVDRKLGYGDGREVRVGETLTVDCKPVLCERGLHASARAIDALDYYSSEGGWICRVEVGGEIVDGADKIVGTSRRCLWMAPADPLLWEWLCRVATKALQEHYPDAPDACWHAIDLRLASEAGLEVDAAAWDAARDAAWAAARDAAWAAARDAARAAARAAAWDAAWAAARTAARAAAWDAQNEELERLLSEAGAP